RDVEKAHCDQREAGMVRRFLPGRFRSGERPEVVLTLNASCFACSLRQAIGNEVGDPACRGRIEIRQDSDRVAVGGTDVQVSIHAGRVAAMAEAEDPITGSRISKTVGIASATFAIFSSGGEEVRMFDIQKLVVDDGICKGQKVANGGITAAR